MKSERASVRVAFLGVGAMGSALIHGALSSGIVQSGKVTAYDLCRERLVQCGRKNKIKISSSNIEAIRSSNFIFVCVKPQQMKDLFLEIKEKVTLDQCLISIMAGVTTRTVEDYFPISVPLIRSMPNSPVLIQNGATAVTKGRFATRHHLQFAIDFFSSVGEAVVLPEKNFDAVTALSGSGPAYVFYLAESLERAGQKLGLSKSVSQLLARQTFLGSGKMLNHFLSPRELRQKVSSPGGTTESAIRYLERKKWAEIFVQAVQKAKERSKELSASNTKFVHGLEAEIG